MANKIILKKSAVPSKIPEITDLDFGELAINYSDGRLYYKTASNSIDYFSKNLEVDSFKFISVSGQQQVSAKELDDTLNLVAGSGINITTSDENSSITISSFSGSSSSVESTTLTVIKRNINVLAILTPLLQTYLNFDGLTFRNNLANVQTRTGSVSVLA